MRQREIHVVAGVILDNQGRVLIARRADKAHQGGLWEFPGGKLEAGETPQQALARELFEELGIRVLQSRPQIRVRHDYGDKQVFLDVWRVERFEGEAFGREGQPLQWVAPERLAEFQFPAANLPILRAAQLPEQYLITPDIEALESWTTSLETALKSGIRLVQLRVKTTPEAWVAVAAARCRELCHDYGARWLFNGTPEQAIALEADGVHLDGRRLVELEERTPGLRWWAASCHDQAQLARARELGCDFAVVSPVFPTASHPGRMSLGWAGFEVLAASAGIPVFALGGLGPEVLAEAWRAGAQGIAAIRGLWPATRG